MRARLRGRQFTIVSNNCWGAHLYTEAGIAYQTPFVGLFLDPNCYINLLSRFRDVIHNPLTFVSESQRDGINTFRKAYGRDYPIGRLAEDIEIQFLHSETEAEAADKWNRRVARISTNDDNLFFKFCDHDGVRVTQEHLEAFDRLPFAHKVCFVAKPHPQLKSALLVPDCVNEIVPDGGALQEAVKPYFDSINWLRGGSGRPKWYSISCRIWPH